MKITFLITGLLLFISINLRAQDEHHQEAHHYKNKFALFTGYSSDLHGNVGSKIGFEYIRVMSDRIALRGALDYLGQNFKYVSISGTFDFRPFKTIPLYTGVGIGAKNHTDDWDPFTRLLIAYDIHFGRFSIGPLLMYDIYSIKNYFTFGLGFDYSF